MALRGLDMTELASIISARSAQINDFLRASSLPRPSLGADSPSPDFLPSDNAEIERARVELREAARELDFLMAGTNRNLWELCIYPMHMSNVLRIIYRYNLAKHVPADGSISYADLANKAGLEEDKVTRVVRYAVTYYVFAELSPGLVSHSASSKLLATDPTAWDTLGHFSEDVYPSVTKTLDALQKWPSSKEPNHTAFNLAFNTDKDPFKYWEAESPANIPRFGNAMTFTSGVLDQYTVEFDWRSLGQAKFVDIGGSNGTKSIAVARVAPKIECIVQDLQEVIDQVPQAPSDVKDRVRYEAYNFFTPQPQKDADVYFYARVLHDWPDAKCIEILRNLVPSMKLGSRLIINETVVAAPTEGNVSELLLSGGLDLQMMIALNARERSLEAWKTLVHDGSSGKLKFEQVSGSVLSFLRS